MAQARTTERRGPGGLAREGTLAQLLAAVVGATFLLVGILGSSPGSPPTTT